MRIVQPRKKFDVGRHQGLDVGQPTKKPQKSCREATGERPPAKVVVVLDTILLGIWQTKFLKYFSGVAGAEPAWLGNEGNIGDNICIISDY